MKILIILGPKSMCYATAQRETMETMPIERSRPHLQTKQSSLTPQSLFFFCFSVKLLQPWQHWQSVRKTWTVVNVAYCPFKTTLHSCVLHPPFDVFLLLKMLFRFMAQLEECSYKMDWVCMSDHMFYTRFKCTNNSRLTECNTFRRLLIFNSAFSLMTSPPC